MSKSLIYASGILPIDVSSSLTALIDLKKEHLKKKEEFCQEILHYNPDSRVSLRLTTKLLGDSNSAQGTPTKTEKRWINYVPSIVTATPMAEHRFLKRNLYIRCNKIDPEIELLLAHLDFSPVETLYRKSLQYIFECGVVLELYQLYEKPGQAAVDTAHLFVELSCTADTHDTTDNPSLLARLLHPTTMLPTMASATRVNAAPSFDPDRQIKFMAEIIKKTENYILYHS